MDTPNPIKKDGHLLDDLESIRQLLGDDGLQPPLLTEAVNGEVQIPLLFDMVGSKPDAPQPPVEAPVPPPVAVPGSPSLAVALVLARDFPRAEPGG